MSELFSLIFTAIIAENAVFVSMCGVDRLRDFSDSPRHAALSGAFLTLVSSISVSLLWVLMTVIKADAAVYGVLAAPIISVAVSVGAVALIKKALPALYRGLKPYLTALTVNSAAVGIVYAAVGFDIGLTESVVFAALSSLGTMFAYLVFAVIWDGIPASRQAAAIRGIPTVLLAAGLIAMVFSGFSGMRI